MYSAARAMVVSTDMRESSRSPIVRMNMPATGKSLNRPHRLMSCPDAMDVTSMPPIIGVICSPDAVGLSPFTTWRKSGM